MPEIGTDSTVVLVSTRFSLSGSIVIEMSGCFVVSVGLDSIRFLRFETLLSNFGRLYSYIVFGAGDAIAMRMSFGKWIFWLEKVTNRIQNVFDSVASSMPFAAAVRHRLSSSGHCSTETRLPAFVMTRTWHWLFGLIVRVRATRIF